MKIFWNYPTSWNFSFITIARGFHSMYCANVDIKIIRIFIHQSLSHKYLNNQPFVLETNMVGQLGCRVWTLPSIQYIEYVAIDQLPITGAWQKYITDNWWWSNSPASDISFAVNLYWLSYLKAAKPV